MHACSNSFLLGSLMLKKFPFPVWCSNCLSFIVWCHARKQKQASTTLQHPLQAPPSKGLQLLSESFWPWEYACQHRKQISKLHFTPKLCELWIVSFPSSSSFPKDFSLLPFLQFERETKLLNWNPNPLSLCLCVCLSLSSWLLHQGKICKSLPPNFDNELQQQLLMKNCFHGEEERNT